VVADATVKTVSGLNPPPEATHAEVQATENDVFYTMDGATDPTPGATGSGMVFRTAHEPKSFLVDDMKRIRFTRAAGADGKISVHWFGGRDI